MVKQSIEIIATLLTIIVGLFTLLIIYRKKQLSIACLYFSIAEFHNLSKKKVKELCKTKISNIFYLINSNRKLPQIVTMPYIFKNNGREPIKSIRFQLEYPEEFLVNNELLESITRFEPIVRYPKNKENVVKILKQGLKEDEIQEMIKARKIQILGSRAIVSFEIPILRNGECIVIPDTIALTGNIMDQLEVLGFGDKGFGHILSRIKKINEVNDYFVVNAWVYSENHNVINRKINVFGINIGNNTNLESVMTKIVESFWLGSLPKSGIYFIGHPVGSWILKKLGYIGRGRGDIYHRVRSVFIYPHEIEIKSSSKKKYLVQNTGESEITYGAFDEPNCNYYELPENIDSHERLMNWLGVSNNPLMITLQKV